MTLRQRNTLALTVIVLAPWVIVVHVPLGHSFAK